jgi:spore germination protein YaaH
MKADLFHNPKWVKVGGNESIYIFKSLRAYEIVREIGEYLTYLSPFSYSVREDGSLSSLQDTELLTVASAKHVAPLMVHTNFRQGEFNSDLAHEIFINKDFFMRLTIMQLMVKLSILLSL